MLRTAKVIFSQSVVDCLVLDESASGLRVSSEIFMPFPETVMVELRSGGRWHATRRWQRGLETGLEFISFAGLNAQARLDAATLYAQLCNAGLRDVTARLAAKNHFDNPALKDAAETAETALATLERVLKGAGN